MSVAFDSLFLSFLCLVGGAHGYTRQQTRQSRHSKHADTFDSLPHPVVRAAHTRLTQHHLHPPATTSFSCHSFFLFLGLVHLEHTNLSHSQALPLPSPCPPRRRLLETTTFTHGTPGFVCSAARSTPPPFAPVSRRCCLALEDRVVVDAGHQDVALLG